MSYEVVDGMLFQVDVFEGVDGNDVPYRQDCGPVDEAVADALKVLEAAGWTAVTYHRVVSIDRGSPTEESTWVHSPWRQVSS